MSPLANTVINVLSTLTLVGQVVSLVFLALIIARKLNIKNKSINKLDKLVTENYITIVFVVSAFATIGSLTLSEVLNFIPCKLCWYQRILMYPIALISFVALITNERIKKYILTLSVIGILIAGYHILLQFLPNVFECNDEVAKCSAVQFAKFGYITIPVMAFTAFLLIILASLTEKSQEK